MKRILVTGGTGFIGANLTRRLVETGHNVHLLVRDTCNSWRIAEVADKLVLHYGDLLDKDKIRQIVAEVRPEWVFHLAVYGAYSWQSKSQRIIETNLLGTAHLLESCLETDFEIFVNTGSSSEYGYKSSAANESSLLEPNSCYAVAKASATMYCQFVARTRRAPVVTLRLYSVYGPLEDPGRFMPSLTLGSLRGKLPPLADPRTARDYVYIDDVIDAYLLAAISKHEPGSVYNVGTAKQTTLHDAVEMARQVFGCADTPKWNAFPNRSWDTDVWIANIKRIRKALGWQPAYSLETGLRSFGNWFCKRQGMQEFYRSPNNRAAA